ncbi:MAG: hypothetical protein JXA79_12165, partial [Deltaproteobacteria bacterium]|nr:hypothetical protein [Deltaproteobacteria bacterium]
GIRFCIEEPDGAVAFDATPIDEDVDEMMTDGPAIVSRKKDDIIEWLMTTLNGNSMAVKEIEEKALEAGHSWGVVQKVTARQNIVHKWKSGKDGQWFWELKHHP